MTPKTITFRQLRHHGEIYLLMIPTVLLIGLFSYYPAASGVFHSFFRWNGADIAEWVGTQNYGDLLRSSAFWDSFSVAFYLGAWNVIKMIPPLLVAVCIHRAASERLQFLYRALFVVPMVIPGLVVVLIWKSFFFETTSGYLNWFLSGSGLLKILCWLDLHLGWGGIFAPDHLPSWLGDPRLTLTSCIIWGFPWVGSFAILMHLAKLQQIPKSVYEAAEIDGVTWWTKFTEIELPLILGSVYIMLVFVIIDTIRDAGTIFLLVGMEGGPGGVATVPALFMLREAFINQNMGYACAVGIILTTVVMLLHKASTTVIGWSTLTPRQRVTARAVALAVAVLPLCFGRLVGVSTIVIAAALPWPAILARLKLPSPASLFERRQQASRKRFRVAAGAEPAVGDGRGRERRDAWLRFLKHGYVWFVLAMAFLPVYLMGIVMLKTNQQFYEAPARLTAPYHWENLTTAWAAVGPTLANSFFICISATAIALFAAICAAYFFARVKVPGSAFLWNAILILMMLPSIANLIPLFRLLADLDLLNTLTALILVSAAGGQVAAIFVLRNFVAEMGQELFDAAEVDGASHFQQIRAIVIPQAGPILGTMGVMHFLGEWNNFVLPLIVMRDQSRLPAMVGIVRMAGEYIKYWGPLMAAYTLTALPIVVLFIFTMRLFMKGLSEGGSAQ